MELFLRLPMHCIVIWTRIDRFSRCINFGQWLVDMMDVTTFCLHVWLMYGNLQKITDVRILFLGLSLWDQFFCLGRPFEALGQLANDLNVISQTVHVLFL